MDDDMGTGDLLNKLKPFSDLANFVGGAVQGVMHPTPKQSGPVDQKSLLDRNQAYTNQRKGIKVATPSSTSSSAPSSSLPKDPNATRIQTLKDMTVPPPPPKRIK